MADTANSSGVRGMASTSARCKKQDVRCLGSSDRRRCGRLIGQSHLARSRVRTATAGWLSGAVVSRLHQPGGRGAERAWGGNPPAGHLGLSCGGMTSWRPHAPTSQPQHSVRTATRGTALGQHPQPRGRSLSARAPMLRAREQSRAAVQACQACSVSRFAMLPAAHTADLLTDWLAGWLAARLRTVRPPSSAACVRLADPPPPRPPLPPCHQHHCLLPCRPCRSASTAASTSTAADAGAASPQAPSGALVRLRHRPPASRRLDAPC